MKNVFLFLLFLMIGKAVHAQQSDVETPQVIEKQIGINATNFFLRFVSFNEAQDAAPSFLFYYKKGNNKKKRRHGFGGSFSWEKDSDNDLTRFIQLDYSYGKEYYKPISKRWKVYHAWETLLSLSSFSSKPERRDKDYFRTAGLGFQMIGGIQFQWNERLSLLTETNYGLIFRFQGDENKNETYNINTFYKPPIDIILNYHF